MGTIPACPHCGMSIDPPPKRSRKCPHCRMPIVVRRGRMLTEQGASELDAKHAVDRAATKDRAKAQRFRQARKTTAQQLRQAKRSGVVSGIKAFVSDNDCRACQAVRGKVFPIGTCTVEMLPPYANCELEDGCRSCITTVLDPRYEDPPGRRSGCLGLMVLALAIALTAVLPWQ